jgi:hypothetical protein
MTVYVDNYRVPAKPDVEEWRPVTLSPRYQVSSLGRVRGSRGGILRGNRLTGGYLQVKVYLDGSESRCQLIHCLVAAAFLGERPAGHEVNHKDGDTSNNRLNNLEYATPSANMLHSYRELGRKGARGSRFARSSLNEATVIDIRERYAGGGVSTVQLAKEYGVSRPTIGKIVNRQIWRHAEVDVVDTKRDEAIEQGAKSIDIRDFGAIVSARRGWYRENAIEEAQ